MLLNPNPHNEISSSGNSPTQSSSDDVDNSLSPTQLLALAIKKRRRLIEDKDRDFRQELLHTSVIQSLCKYLGENRAKARRSKRRQRRRPIKRRWSQEGDDRSDQEVPDPDFHSFTPKNGDHSGFDSAVQSNGVHGRLEQQDYDACGLALQQNNCAVGPSPHKRLCLNERDGNAFFCHGNNEYVINNDDGKITKSIS